jgi:hypothetical protein
MDKKEYNKLQVRIHVLSCKKDKSTEEIQDLLDMVMAAEEYELLNKKKRKLPPTVKRHS